MSSILIKGMTMPETCEECPCYRHDSMDGAHAYQCNITFNVNNWGLTGRPSDCPLVEVKTPHGRLIDDRIAQQSIGDHMTGLSGRDGRSDWQRVHDGLAGTPTVIEAEGE